LTPSRTAANWNKVDEKSRVVNPRTGVHCSFAEWEDDVDEWNDNGDGDYDDSVDDFLSMMRKWTREMEKDSLTTLGFKLTKPNPGQYSLTDAVVWKRNWLTVLYRR
jgi:hypothetical protein